MIKHQLSQLPYPENALEPHISEETLRYHYGKHHAAYVDKLNKMLEGSGLEHASIEQIIMNADGGLFNNAAQVWNHGFYWNCMTPDANDVPGDDFRQVIDDNFGDFGSFKQAFKDEAIANFGSGWTWLVKKPDGELDIVNTDDADNPMRQGLRPLLTCDVWEHAYYIDYRNARGDYVDAFWKLVDWQFVSANNRRPESEQESVQSPARLAQTG